MVMPHLWLCKFSTIVVLFLLLPILVTSQCTFESINDDHNMSKALKYKIMAAASILMSSAIGVYLPFLTTNISCFHPDSEIYFLIKAFAAGVILATGFVHILPDAYESLTDPCLAENPWGKFPFAGFVTMMSAIGTLVMEAFASGYHERTELRRSQPVNCDEESDGARASHNHMHGSALMLERISSAELLRHRVISQVLELGIVVHSVIIGLSLGASGSLRTIKPLVAALSLHQFFEGMGLGGCISQAEFKRRTIIFMVLFFSLTTPTGIAIGIGISNIYNKNSATALIVQGLFNSASAGILIYMALVDLLAADFMKTKLLSNFRLQIGATCTLLLGSFCMSVLALWGES